ncbi:hypothetical protein OUZ56_023933 [Daphnia magna]|uniref:Uncharacterized protein n=1 Tax=Daphnia magna TaxID=35525 RepID=A0ABR0B008_9CRUS|nr:hypothetical protein OUZ56_023933 [Daphnia magna]
MDNDIYIQTRQLVPYNQNGQISIAQLFIFHRRPSRSSNKKQQLHYEASSKHNLTVVAHHTDISTLLSVHQAKVAVKMPSLPPLPEILIQHFIPPPNEFLSSTLLSLIAMRMNS